MFYFLVFYSNHHGTSESEHKAQPGSTQSKRFVELLAFCGCTTQTNIGANRGLARHGSFYAYSGPARTSESQPECSSGMFLLFQPVLNVAGNFRAVSTLPVLRRLLNGPHNLREMQKEGLHGDEAWGQRLRLEGDDSGGDDEYLQMPRLP
jgi:hypothetical protein